MFRTHNLRGRRRFVALRKAKNSKKAYIKLNKKQLNLIENTKVLSLSEKIELLLVSLGNKLTTELYENINYSKNNSAKLAQPNKNDLKNKKKLLEQLPFIYYQDFLPNKKNKQTGQLENFTWFQVSVNKTVARFLMRYPDDLTEFEEGILYGFPLSAIRAFSGLIESEHAKSTPAAYYLAGVCSKDFWDD